MASGPTGFPTLQPAFILKINLGRGYEVGQVFTGSTFSHYEMSSGTITTVEGFEPKLELEVVYGGDWFYIDPDQEHGRVNVRGIARTADGQAISYAYIGSVASNDDIRAIFSHSPDAKTHPFGQTSSTLTFEVGPGKLKSLENCTWVGNGRFVVGKDTIWVETRVSKLVPSTDMD